MCLLEAVEVVAAVVADPEEAENEFKGLALGHAAVKALLAAGFVISKSGEQPKV